MAKQLQFRRGTTSELSNETGSLAELFVDTDKKTVVVMNGVLGGGYPLARESFVNAIEPSVFNINSSSTAVHITQTGTGNALVVEDSANPDSTPTVITKDGCVIIGGTTPIPSYQFADPQLFVFGKSSGAPKGAQYTVVFSNDVYGAAVELGKSRSTTIGTVGTIVQSGDELGIISFNGDDGVDLRTPGATIRAQVDGTPGANDMPGRLVFSTTADGASSPTERMRITSTGNVGIGITPVSTERLHIHSAAGAGRSTIRTSFTDATEYGEWNVYEGSTFKGGLSLFGSSYSTPTWRNAMVITAATNDLGSIIFRTRTSNAYAERMVISNSGYIGVGTSSPEFNVHVVGDVDPIAFSIDGYGAGSPAFITRKALGTVAAPLAITTNTTLFTLGTRGYTGTGFTESTSGAIKVSATENWSPTSNGVKMEFDVTENGTNSKVTRLLIDHDGTTTITGNTIINSTGYIKVATGTTAQRPTGVTGYVRFNTIENALEVYNNTEWDPTIGRAAARSYAIAMAIGLG